MGIIEKLESTLSRADVEVLHALETEMTRLRAHLACCDDARHILDNEVAQLREQLFDMEEERDEVYAEGAKDTWEARDVARKYATELSKHQLEVLFDDNLPTPDWLEELEEEE
jgi:hypothetical protein